MGVVYEFGSGTNLQLAKADLEQAGVPYIEHVPDRLEVPYLSMRDRPEYADLMARNGGIVADWSPEQDLDLNA